MKAAMAMKIMLCEEGIVAQWAKLGWPF